MPCDLCGQDVPLIPVPEDAAVVTCLQCRSAMACTPGPSNSLRRDGGHAGVFDRGQGRWRGGEVPPLVADDDDWDDMYDPSFSHDTQMIESGTKTYRVEQAWRERKLLDEFRGVRRPRSNWLQWLILSLGVALFSCGAALVAWSFGEDRQDLWNVGAPMALAGQAAFLIGLVLQLDVIWQQSKLTSRRLEHLHPQGTTTAAPSVAHRDAERPSAENGRSPDTETLLSDLKGQLDRMATRLSRRSDS